MFPTSFTDRTYYDGSYPFGPLGSWDKIHRYFKANPNKFILDPNEPAEHVRDESGQFRPHRAGHGRLSDEHD